MDIDELRKFRAQIDAGDIDYHMLADLIGTMVANGECRCYKCDGHFFIGDRQYRCVKEENRTSVCREWSDKFWAAHKAITLLFGDIG